MLGVFARRMGALSQQGSNPLPQNRRIDPPMMSAADIGFYEANTGGKIGLGNLYAEITAARPDLAVKPSPSLPPSPAQSGALAPVGGSNLSPIQDNLIAAAMDDLPVIEGRGAAESQPSMVIADGFGVGAKSDLPPSPAQAPTVVPVESPFSPQPTIASARPPEGWVAGPQANWRTVSPGDNLAAVTGLPAAPVQAPAVAPRQVEQSVAKSQVPTNPATMDDYLTALVSAGIGLGGLGINLSQQLAPNDSQGAMTVPSTLGGPW